MSPSRLASFLLGTFLAGAASAAPEASSRYSPLDLAKPGCRTDPGPAEGSVCTGIAGWEIRVGFPAFGATVQIARRGRLRPNGLDAKDGRSLAIDGIRATPIEWRGTVRGRGFEPYAAILRVSVLDAAQRQAAIEDGGTLPAKPLRTQVLIVHRLGPEGSCPVAYVDAQPDANTLARDAADGIARQATCPVAAAAVIGRASTILTENLR